VLYRSFAFVLSPTFVLLFSFHGFLERYASGATIQVLLFGVLAIKLKRVAPTAHTACEIVNARWGRNAHKTFLFFCFCANIIVTSMLLLGGAATVEALTGMDYRLASFLIPWGIILYTAFGGLQGRFLASYIQTNIIFSVVITMVFLVYVKAYSSDEIYDLLHNTVSKTTEQCEAIFSFNNGTTFFEQGKYACGPVPGNRDGSYLTMLSGDGLMFGVINIVGNFGTVFVDQSYWQSAIAARPSAAAKGYLLGGYVMTNIHPEHSSIVNGLTLFLAEFAGFRFRSLLRRQSGLLELLLCFLLLPVKPEQAWSRQLLRITYWVMQEQS
jgi:urea-proton symporter